jgi:hypothetical protein
MLLSEKFTITFRGKPAQLRVVRNNAHCWAEVSQGAENFAISTSTDHYERTDEDAAAAFERAAKRNPQKNVGPSLLSIPVVTSGKELRQHMQNLDRQNEPSLADQALTFVRRLDNATLPELCSARAALIAHGRDLSNKASERAIAKQLRAVIRTK